MEIKRDSYLEALKIRMWNGQIKIVTGIRRCGKSYLLKIIFKKFLKEKARVRESNILIIDLEKEEMLRYRNPLELSRHVREWKKERKGDCFLLIDEIQMCGEVKNPHLPEGGRIGFYDVLNGFMDIPGLDVYVTGSNSKMLSSDVLTEFRGRGDEIRLHPLTFGEFYQAMGGDKREQLERYLRYGGMPFAVLQPNDSLREAYLQQIFELVYFKDIVERKKIERPDVLAYVTDFLCSSMGSLTNPANMANSLASTYDCKVSKPTVKAYLDTLLDAFLFSEAKRYDIKGRTYFNYPSKYYCEDIGLRNARLGYRQQEATHAMENVLYSDLLARGFRVDVGVVFSRGKDAKGKETRTAREIDFVVNKTGERVYIQSAFELSDEKKRFQELLPFSLTGDSFRKIVVRQDVGLRWFDEKGVLNVSLADFLLDPGIV